MVKSFRVRDGRAAAVARDGQRECYNVARIGGDWGVKLHFNDVALLSVPFPVVRPQNSAVRERGVVLPCMAMSRTSPHPHPRTPWAIW